MRKTLIGSLAVLAAGTYIAQSAEPAHSAAITDYAVYRNPSVPTTQTDQVVHIQSGRAWKIKKSAAALDAQVDGLTINVGAPGSCVTEPTALCVTVVVGSFNDEGQRTLAGFDDDWRGLTTWDSPDARTIYLNTWNTKERSKKVIAAHELGHAVGLDHDSHGLMAINTRWFSDAELNALRTWYSIPRYAPAN